MDTPLTTIASALHPLAIGGPMPPQHAGGRFLKLRTESNGFINQAGFVPILKNRAHLLYFIAKSNRPPLLGQCIPQCLEIVG
jgi:hypothetical protein